jgi:uncharacterized membrane protein YgcG
MLFLDKFRYHKESAIINMKLKLLTILILFSLNYSLIAQTNRDIKGVLQDTTGAPVFSATVKLITLNDTLSTRSDVDGNFLFKGIKVTQFGIVATSLGYIPLLTRFVYQPGTSTIVLPKIVMKAGSNMLAEVVVDGTPAVVIKQDTIEFRISDLRLKDDAVVEDAIKRLDGTEVDKDGNVTVAGKPVTKIKINGKEVFGGDLKTLTKNIPANAIDKIQIIDDYGDQANFTKVKDGDPETIINITTKPGRNTGLIMNSTVGGGSEDRYQLGIFASQFKGDKNIGITANLNNNGTQVGGGGFGGRGGSSGGANFGASGGGFSGRGGGGSGDNFGASGGGGITNLSSIGLSYNNRWSPKLEVSGSYYFTNSDRSTISNVFRQSANATGLILSTEYTDVASISNTHNFGGKLEYSINKSNMLIVYPYISFSNSNSNNAGSISQTGVIRQNQFSVSSNKSVVPNISGNILFNHNFAKQGRNYSFNINLRNGGLNSDQENDNQIVYFDPTGNTLRDSINYRLNTIENRVFNGSNRFSYSEPISEKSRIQMSYNVTYNSYDNSRLSGFNNANGILQNIDSLSNVFQYNFLSQQFGLNYNYKTKTNEFSLGIRANPTTLSGNSETLNSSINRTNLFFAPIVRYQYKYSQTKSISVYFYGFANEPQFNQLQPVRDISNPQRPIVGNPDLNSAFSQNLNAYLNTSNPNRKTSFILNLQANMLSNQVVQNIVLIPDVYGSKKQEIRFVNANGYYTYFGSYNWQKSFKDKQYTIKLNGDTRYTNNVSFADNIRNTSQRRNISQRLGLQINPGDWMELTPNLSFSRTNTNYSLETNTDILIKTYAFNLDGRILFQKSKTLILGFSVDKSFNRGFSANLNTNPLIINAYIEKQFLKNKMALVRFQGFDVLDQSNNILRSVVDNGFTDVRTNRLTRYFMLTLNVRINKLVNGKGPVQNQDNSDRYNRGYPGGGGMRGSN